MKSCVLLISPEKMKLYQRQRKGSILLEEQKTGVPLHLLPDASPLLLLVGFPLTIVSESLPPLPSLDRPLVFRNLRKKYFGQSSFFTCRLKKTSRGFSFLGFSVDPPSFPDIPDSHQVFALESLIPALLKKETGSFCVLLEESSEESSFIAFNQGFPFALKKLHNQPPEKEWAAFRRYLEKHHQLRILSYTTLRINDALLRNILALLPRHRSLNLSHERKSFFGSAFLSPQFLILRKMILPSLILLNFWQTYTYYDLRKEIAHVALSLKEERKKMKTFSQTEEGFSLLHVREVAYTWEKLIPTKRSSWKEAFVTLEKSLKKEWSLFEILWQRSPQNKLIFKMLQREEGDLSKLKKILSGAFHSSRISFESQGEEEDAYKKLIVRIQEERDDS